MDAVSLLDIVYRHLDSHRTKMAEAKGQQSLLNKMRDARTVSPDTYKRELEACRQVAERAEIAVMVLTKVLDEFAEQNGTNSVTVKPATVKKPRRERKPTYDVRQALDKICAEGGEWTFGQILDRVRVETGRTVATNTVRSIIQKQDPRFENLGGGRYRIR